MLWQLWLYPGKVGDPARVPCLRKDENLVEICQNLVDFFSGALYDSIHVKFIVTFRP